MLNFEQISFKKSNKMTDYTIKTQDNLSLFVKKWIPETYRATVLLVHGFGEHCSRYEHVAQYFNQRGYAFIAYDLRGHGNSEGKRGHASSIDVYLDDVDIMLKEAEKLGKPVFLYGHSMGGQLVLTHTLKRKSVVKGVFASSPWTRLAFEPKAIMVTIGKIVRSIAPAFTQNSGLNTAHISTLPEVVEAYKNDPLNHAKISAAAGLGLSENGLWLDEFAGRFPLPLLIMHGTADKITSQPASEAFAKRVAGDITYKKWEGMYHEVHNDKMQKEFLAAAVDWFDKY